ncbi:hypothetical protein SPLC1_S207690 [Arthrospira platensis C1]|nr:hypothetical protein SPLC1_S207690 [Arthrospira platensis C1]
MPKQFPSPDGGIGRVGPYTFGNLTVCGFQGAIAREHVEGA